MRITHDPHGNAVYIYLKDGGKTSRTLTVTQEVNLDVSAEGQLVGIEVLNASETLDLSYVLSEANSIKELGEPTPSAEVGKRIKRQP